MISTILALSFSLTSQISLPTYDPSLDWQTTSTEHFEIHFEPRTRDVAKQLVNRCEIIYSHLTREYDWEQRGKIHVVITDHEVSANGFSTPIPYNMMHLFPVPPEEGSSLDYYDDWLLTLFGHEFTHSVHIDKVEGLNRALRAVLGKTWSPNAAQQQWGIEGLAVWEETRMTSMGRGRSPFVSMFLRTAALENKLDRIDRGTYWNDHYPYGNSAYWYGIAFYQYLEKNYGEQAIINFVDETSRVVIPSFFNFKSDKIFGKSLTRLWDEWQQSLKDESSKLVASYRPQLQSRHVTNEDDHLCGNPTWSEDGLNLYACTLRNHRPGLLVLKWENADSKPTSDWSEAIKANDLSESKGWLFYSKSARGEVTDQYSQYDAIKDIYAYNVKEKKDVRITRGFRVQFPVIKDSWIYALEQREFKYRIVRFPLPELKIDDDFEWKPIESNEPLEILFEGAFLTSLGKPTVSPDGKSVVFSMKTANGYRDLYKLDIKAKKLDRLTNDFSQDQDPIYSPDGSAVIFSSDRLLGNTNTSVINLFAFRFSDRSIVQLTDAWTGAGMAAPRPLMGKKSESEMALGIFHAQGFQPELASYSVSHSKIAAMTKSPKQAPIPMKDFPDVPLQGRPYDSGNTLLPHYFYPFYFYTESDSAAGAVTGSFDPLARHAWSAIGYHMFSPNRPGGGLNYMYRGIPDLTLYTGGGASISNYGNLSLATIGPRADTGALDVLLYTEDYYQRIYSGVAGLSTPIYWNHKRTKFSVGGLGFVRYEEPLLALPALNHPPSFLINGTTPLSSVIATPERGLTWGGQLVAYWSDNLSMNINGVNPASGSTMKASVEYSPDKWGSEFESLTTILTGTFYQDIVRDYSIGFSFISGLQWLEPRYLRTFRLGGSFGSGPFASISDTAFPLRGIGAGELKGEGIVAANFEFRFPLLRDLPGFGTAPLWVKNISAALFSDGGQAFLWKEKRNLIEERITGLRKKWAWDEFSLSSGIELRTQVSTLYSPPLTFRLGYGHVLYYRGTWIGDENRNQVYALAGTSF